LIAKPKIIKCKAKGCFTRFEPAKSFIKWCSPECGAVIGVALNEKKKAKAKRDEDKKHREAKIKAQPLGYWVKRAEKEFNAFIRKRDSGLGCI